jgi:hypothetical protein
MEVISASRQGQERGIDRGNAKSPEIQGFFKGACLWVP